MKLVVEIFNAVTKSVTLDSYLWGVYGDGDIKIGHSNFHTVFKNHFNWVKQMGRLLKQKSF